MAASLATSFSPLAKDDGKSTREAEAMAEEGVVHSGYVPANLHRQLEFMDMNEDGHLVLGCSDLTGRYWTGSLWYYRNPSEAPSIEKALTGVDCDNGMVDGKFVGNKRIIVALDNGSLEQFRLTFSDENPETSGQEAFFFLERQASVQEHDDIITGLDISPDGSQVITSSFDKSVVVLDLDTLRLDCRISDAHDDLISNVAFSRKNGKTFATAGNDGTVALWDLASSQRTSRIYEDRSSWPCCVEYVPGAEFYLVVGTQSGHVHLFDIRRSDQAVFAEKVLDGQLHQVRFSTLRPHLFAVVGDTTTVKVMALEEGLTKFAHRYSDDEHSDFVRGLTWNPETDDLYSCGWDHRVLKHTV